MSVNPERLRDIRKELRILFDDISRSTGLHYPTDYNRFLFLYSELDTLMVALDLSERKSYKESFILLRTVLEKLLYFWLMLEGKKYEHSIPEVVEPEAGRTVQDTRDRKLKELKSKLGKDLPKQIVNVRQKENDMIMYDIKDRHTSSAED